MASQVYLNTILQYSKRFPFLKKDISFLVKKKKKDVSFKFHHAKLRVIKSLLYAVKKDSSLYKP